MDDENDKVKEANETIQMGEEEGYRRNNKSNPSLNHSEKEETNKEKGKSLTQSIPIRVVKKVVGHNDMDVIACSSSLGSVGHATPCSFW